ncbi:MAG: MATE family efflux transporter [Firmicutes bacterium]|nr:MATE family efflux transporter [Bacillota bacterium]
MNVTAALQKSSITTREKVGLAWRLSLPAILAQITTILMQYIDAAMVGQMGAAASASIGLVSSSLWLCNGVGSAATYGYSVQIAQAVGAGDIAHARSLYRQGLIVVLTFGCLIGGIGLAISGSLPRWLGGAEEVCRDASAYFRVYMWTLPVVMLQRFVGSSLQSAGNMKAPSILNSCMCVLDVIFNMVLIFPTGMFTLGPLRFYLHGAGLGVYGAAWGTALSHIVIFALLFYVASMRQHELHFEKHGSFRVQRHDFRRAWKIGVPIGLEQAATCGAQVMQTRIVAPLGTVAIAANSFAVTAESLCYMPGYGLGAAATTLVGQSIGAKRKDLAKSFSWITTFMGIAIMTGAGIIMYFVCPYLFRFLTPVPEVQELGTKVLRIELLAEPMFAASIVANGALVGAGDTLIPSIMNLASMWGVRITIAAILAGTLGLTGVWIAMCVELTFRGIIFLIRLGRGRWMRKMQEAPSHG